MLWFKTKVSFYGSSFGAVEDIYFTFMKLLCPNVAHLFLKETYQTYFDLRVATCQSKYSGAKRSVTYKM